GQLTVASGHVPAHSLFGFATLGVPAVFPSWLSAVLFAWLDGVGGLALIVAVTATIAGLTHGLLADLFRRRSVDATRVVLASVVAVALASADWLARPHAFSLLFAVVLLLLLESGRSWSPWAIGALFALWANVHGGWAYGLILVACYVL